MSSATTIAAVATAVSAGAGILGSMKAAQGAQYSSQAQANADTYNSEVAANNAALAKQNASMAAAEGNAKVEVEQLATRAKVGGIVANQAASGVNVNSGSALDVRSSARETGELNAINIRADAARQAYGYQTEAAGYTAQSGLDKASATNAKTAGDINAQSSLISGVGDVGSSFGKFMQAGGLGGGSSSSDSTSDDTENSAVEDLN